MKEAGRIIVEEFNGRIPDTIATIRRIPGVGDKAVKVFLGEIFGLYNNGIPVDRHVYNFARCLGWHEQPVWLASEDPDHAERSLRTWVSVGDYGKINAVLGGMAQIWTTTYRTINPNNVSNARKVLSAIADHIWKPYHLEVLWYAIASARNFYLSKKIKQ